jgi:hypothetical protein
MIELIDGISTYEYQYKLIVDKTNGIVGLDGSWKSLIDSNLFGKLSMICEKDVSLNLISGLWIGQSIRWCLTLFKTNNEMWKLFGSGYSNDSADQFFSLNGFGLSLDDMNIMKKYSNKDSQVEYKGKFVKDEFDKYTFEGRWNNESLFVKQIVLNPLIEYRIDTCLCEVCGRRISPGENRWCCFDCHFSTCDGCDLIVNHEHELILSILPNQKTANGNSCAELISNAFEFFDSSPFLIYRDNQTNELIKMTYGQMSIKCQILQKYWKQFV